MAKGKGKIEIERLAPSRPRGSPQALCQIAETIIAVAWRYIDAPARLMTAVSACFETK